MPSPVDRLKGGGVESFGVSKKRGEVGPPCATGRALGRADADPCLVLPASGLTGRSGGIVGERLVTMQHSRRQTVSRDPATITGRCSGCNLPPTARSRSTFRIVGVRDTSASLQSSRRRYVRETPVCVHAAKHVGHPDAMEKESLRPLRGLCSRVGQREQRQEYIGVFISVLK